MLKIIKRAIERLIFIQQLFARNHSPFSFVCVVLFKGVTLDFFV